MKKDTEKKGGNGGTGDPRRGPYDPAPPGEDDLWFLPGPPEDIAPADPPWPQAPRPAGPDPAAWRAGEAARYRELVAAAQALARFGERLRRFPAPVAGRFALSTVAALLRAEGVWIAPEQLALYRSLRLAADDRARDLARAGWALRRLEGGPGPVPDLVQGPVQDPAAGLRGFLGRAGAGDDDDEEDGGRRWAAALAGLDGCHPLTRAAYGLACWRALAITPWEDLLEPAVAALRIGAADLAPFLPLAPAARLDRSGDAGARLAGFYAAAEAGALAACLELDRLARWQDRAGAATGDLSGRIPPRLIAALLAVPVLPADLAAELAGCSRPAARRNLGLLAARGLVREVTGQDRYRFWTARL